MNYPNEYIRYLAHFHGNRDFFECHEILEEYWKSQPPRDEIWVALIQIAVGLYHHRRGNYGGAEKMLRSSMNKMNDHDITRLGIDLQLLQELLLQRIEAIRNKEEYSDLNLPLTDPELENECKEECLRNGWQWQSASPRHDSLIHRHTLRDRSDVIREREENLRMKRE